MKIIVDTREKQPWLFKSTSAETISQKLDAGDYTVVDCEDILRIERKKSVSELARNVVEKRFDRELERLSAYRYSFLILEFDYWLIDVYPDESDIPKKARSRIKIKAPFIMKKLAEIQVKYNVGVLACSNIKYAEHVAYNLMKQVYESRIS